MANYSPDYYFYGIDYGNAINESERCAGHDKDSLLASIKDKGMDINNYCVFATEAEETTHYRTLDEALANYHDSVIAIIGFSAIITTFNVAVEIDDTTVNRQVKVQTYINNSVYWFTARLLDDDDLFLELKEQLLNKYPEYEDLDESSIKKEMQKFCKISCNNREWLEEEDVIEDIVDFANNKVHDPVDITIQFINLEN